MKVIITGTTGYVGEGVSRRPCGHSHPKLEEYVAPDFLALEPDDPKLQGYDAV